MNTYQLQFLKGKKLKTFLAIADRIIPEENGLKGAGTMETAAVVDWSMKRMPSDIRKKILLFIAIIEILGFFKGLRGFSKLKQLKQDKILSNLENSKLNLFRMGFFGIRTYVCMGYYTRDTIWQEINYDGPILKERNYVDSAIRALCNEELKVQA